MKLKNLIVFCLLVFLLTSCKSVKELHEKIVLDNEDYVDITLYTASEETLTECKEKISYYEKLFDRNQEYAGIENVYSINKKRRVNISEELIEGIVYANDILSKYESASILAGELNDLWKDAYLKQLDPEVSTEKNTPTEENILNAIERIQQSSIEIEDKTVSIIGNASLDLDFMKKGFIVSKLKTYLEEKGISGYIINYSARVIAFGKNPQGKYFKSSFYGIQNGHYKMNQISMACLGADITYWFGEDGYRYTTLPSCQTGKPYDGYEKVFVFGDDPLTLDILAYVFFNMELEPIQAEEKKYDVYTMMYKNLNLVYRNEALTNLMM